MKMCGGFKFVLLSLSVLVAAAGCSSSNSSPSAPSTPTVSFATQIQAQILNPACTACHTDDGRTPSSNLNLKSGVAISNLVNVACVCPGHATVMRVIPGNPSGSYMIQKLEGAADIVGLRMPRNGPPYLTTDQVALIRQWIQNGAPNN
jgi:mono/diheme cytochrome c family protein